MFVLCCLAPKTAVVFVLFRLFIPLLFVISVFRRKRGTGPRSFDLLVNFWSERRDLNSGPPVPQTGALTGLRYAPNGRDYSGWGEAAQPIAEAIGRLGRTVVRPTRCARAPGSRCGACSSRPPAAGSAAAVASAVP